MSVSHVRECVCSVTVFGACICGCACAVCEVCEYVVHVLCMCVRQPGELLRRVGQERGSEAGEKLWDAPEKIKERLVKVELFF